MSRAESNAELQHLTVDMAQDILPDSGTDSGGERGLPPYLTLDAWRGIASLSVVAFHAAKGILNRHPDLESRSLYAASLWGWLGVQLFFVISGYCITGAALSALRRGLSPFRIFILARIRRIYPPCWFALLGAAFFGMAAMKMAKNGYLHPDAFTEVGIFQHSALYYFANLTLTQFVFHQPILLDVCWSLCYEVSFYLIVALCLLPLTSGKKTHNVLNTLNSITILCLTLLIFAPSYSFYPFDLWPQFGLGVIVYDWLSRPRERTPKIWAAIVLAQTLLLAVLDNNRLGAMQQPARPACIISLAFAAALIVLSRYDKRFSTFYIVQWLSTIGIFSYSLYLTHTLTLRAVNQICELLHIAQPFFVYVLGIGISLGVARLFYVLFEHPFLHAKLHPSNLK